ncbi:hypothetical protein RBB77_01580 [Tunturibacter psychrotolerans]|uniref:Helicase XPB/Ssl2 N-terminal domain-containing protein n=1 Tax=Tunturiibacter psychrotolerans TaxID=3069686 RepID=A0AAU7ZRP5_9BACT
MTLTIHKLRVHCRSPKGVDRVGPLVNELAHGPLSSEMATHLGPSLDRLAPVIRLNRLRVQIKLPSRNLNSKTLANAWSREFALALHRALAHPTSDGTISSCRYETSAAYKSAMLHHIATKGSASCWEFPELVQRPGSSPAQIALGFLLEEPDLIGEVAAQLDRRGQLESLLVLWDELSLERIMQATAGAERNGALSLKDLIDLARAAASAGGLRSEWAFAGRRQAIRLWTRMHSRFPLRGLWHGLRLLQKFLEIPMLLMLRDPALLGAPRSFPPWSEAIVAAGAFANPTSLFSSERLASRDDGEVPTGADLTGASSPNLLSVLEALRSLVPSAAAPLAARGRGVMLQWISSDHAGLLLMVSVVQRLDLWQLIRKPEFIRFGGPRALSFLLAGAGMALLGAPVTADYIDPLVALFAGMFAEPDLAGMRQFFSVTDAGAVAGLVQAETWEQALDLLAVELSRVFAGRVRGFRQASREAVRKQFIRVPGRVLVEPSRVLVVLEHSPWHVALHLSGMDEPLGSVQWLGQRRLEFVLEGL